MKKTLKQIVLSILEESEKSLTAREIAEIITDKEPEFCENKKKNTTRKTEKELFEQLVHEINSMYKRRLEKQSIYRTADRPKKYFYSSVVEDKEEYPAENKPTGVKNQQKEKELYPKLAQFCKSIEIKTLRIDEKKTSKVNGSNYNKWLHADVVGFKDLSSNYNKVTKECFINNSNEKSALYSFEVKDGIIRRSQLREYFFQTVSNSSWANYSYIVSEGIEEDAKEELQLLCASFNIGYIQLNREEPLESDIIIQAQKTDLDWDMIDRISVNPDFSQFLYNISKEYGNHTKEEYAKIRWDIKD